MTGRFSENLTPPYYAVIFANQRTAQGESAYEQAAEQLAEIAQDMPGYLGLESTRDDTGFGITVSYWETEEAIRNWKMHADHAAAQESGKTDWYAHYELRVAKVERAYSGPQGRN
ncbi:antibiotic biosynthesis monooxygenase [Parvularcula sp. IMCC14364]|uniref:antibiotic biosynthesis monooxygenase family protein n=1 Tax=Parvularcula sp. IMCC14364 TaxID=3067902 RepID=UPI002741B55A|nr:antibiotic biosynthesis monooxygenase [Parvularcula sp. IMCC14364]